MKNRRAQNKHTPYKLEINGAEYGCYAEDKTARIIARTMLGNGTATQYRIYEGDRLVDEG